MLVSAASGEVILPSGEKWVRRWERSPTWREEEGTSESQIAAQDERNVRLAVSTPPECSWCQWCGRCIPIVGIVLSGRKVPMKTKKPFVKLRVYE